MFKRICILVMIGIISIALYGCGGKKEIVSSAQSIQRRTKRVQYACKMRCHISDKPGKCPICGMKMTRIK